MTTTTGPDGTTPSSRAVRVAKTARWAGLAIALGSVVFLFLPVTATVDSHEVSCSPAFTMGFPNDPGPDGPTPTDMACAAAAGNNGLWFLGMLLTGLALVVGASVWMGRRKRTNDPAPAASANQVPWRRPTDISDTVLLLVALILVPVLSLIAAIAGLPLLAPSDPGPDGVDALQHELTTRAITALVCCLLIAATLTATVRWRRTRANRYQFTTPPQWPSPPPGWLPPPGWQPPRDWPPAPPGWQFWTTQPVTK